MTDAAGRAKIRPPIGFHGLRHKWASLATMAGMPLLVVAKNLGHSDTRMVEKHYGHLAPSYVAETTGQYAPRFGTATPNNVKPLKTKVTAYG
jgi:integrase